MTDERVWTKYDELRSQLIEAIAQRDKALAEVERLKSIIRAERGKKHLETQGVYQ